MVMGKVESYTATFAGSVWLRYPRLWELLHYCTPYRLSCLAHEPKKVYTVSSIQNVVIPHTAAK